MFLLQLRDLLKLQTDIPAEVMLAESVMAVAHSDDVEKLRMLYIQELTNPYVDANGVQKFFREGGPFENYAPLNDPQQMFLDIGTVDARVAQLLIDIRRRVVEETNNIKAETFACNSEEELAAIRMRGPHHAA